MPTQKKTLEELTISDQLEHQKRHQAALREMHVIAIPQPLLGLPTDLSFLALGIPRRNEFVPAKVVAEILDNHTRLRDHDGLGCRRALNGNNR